MSDRCFVEIITTKQFQPLFEADEVCGQADDVDSTGGSVILTMYEANYGLYRELENLAKAHPEIKALVSQGNGDEYPAGEGYIADGDYNTWDVCSPGTAFAFHVVSDEGEIESGERARFIAFMAGRKAVVAYLKEQGKKEE